MKVEKRKKDIDGIDLIEEEEIHYVTTKHPTNAQDDDELICDSCERSNDPDLVECNHCGEFLDVTHDKHNRVLDDLHEYMESEYPNTNIEFCKVLYGSRIDRLEEYIEDVDANFLALHKDYIQNAQEFANSISVPVVILG